MIVYYWWVRIQVLPGIFPEIVNSLPNIAPLSDEQRYRKQLISKNRLLSLRSFESGPILPFIVQFRSLRLGYQ